MSAASRPVSKSWQSVLLAPEEAPADYQRDAFAYWERLCGARFAPRWEDVDMAAFRPEVVDAMIVVDIDPGTLDMTYRFWGAALTALHGEDFTGRSPADLKPRPVGYGTADSYRQLIAEKTPHLEVWEFYRGRTLAAWQTALRMPLSGDGRSVTGVLNVTYYDPAAKAPGRVGVSDRDAGTPGRGPVRRSGPASTR